MFNSISWTQYLGVAVLLLIIYYVFVGLKFYSTELRSLLKRKATLPISLAIESPADNVIDRNNHYEYNQPELFPSYKKYTPPEQETDDTFQQVAELTANLKEVIATAADKKYIKEEFILSLQYLLKKYQFLKGSPSQAAVNNLIAFECEKYGYIQLSAEERLMLWNE